MATRKKGKDGAAGKDTGGSSSSSSSSGSSRGRSKEGKSRAGKTRASKGRDPVRGKSPALPAPGFMSQAAAGPAGSIARAREFLREVALEFRKITWPGRAQIVQETYSVIVLVTVITVMVLGMDWLLGHLIFGPIEFWAKAHGGGSGRGL